MKNHGVLYECRPAPFSTWCSGAGYEPGVSANFRDAWLRVDKCINAAPSVFDQVTGYCPGNPAACCPSGYTPLVLSQNPDVVQAVQAKQCIVALGGDDTIAANSSASIVIGGSGRDTIQSANGTNYVVPGAGTDTVFTGTGDDTVAIFDLCEVTSGEKIDMGSGFDTLISPVPLAQLQAMGVSVLNVDRVLVQQNSCRSECGAVPSCSGHGTCIEGAAAGQTACDCQEPFAGPNCESTRIAATQNWVVPTGSLGAFGRAGFDTSGGILSDARQTVVAVSATGQVSTPFPANGPKKFAIDPSAARFGVNLATQFEVHDRTGAIVATYPRHAEEFGELVPNTNLVFLPEVPDTFEKASITNARFYDPTGLKKRFAVPGLRVSRLTSTRLAYATQSDLVLANQQGTELWRRALKLVTFEVSSNGATLIGVVQGPGSSVVHVSLATGTVSAPVALNGAFWNIAAAPGGRFTVATTQSSVYLFDQGKLARQIDIPAKWIISADVSDAGTVAVGAQLATHEGLFMVLGGNSTGAASAARVVDNDGYRPEPRFFPNGQQVLLNETGGLVAFKLTP